MGRSRKIFREVAVSLQREHSVCLGFLNAIAQQMFKYGRSPLDRSRIGPWRDDYQTRGSHNNRGRNGVPRIGTTLRIEIQNLFDDDPRISLHTVAAQIGAFHSILRNLIRRELKLHL